MTQSAHARSSSLRLLLAGLALWAVAGCAPVPEAKVNQAIEQAADGAETPQLVGARGPLTPAQSKSVLARLQTEARESDLLARHLAIEQAVAETPLVVGNKTQILRDGA
jgi:cardiolipin synthase